MAHTPHELAEEFPNDTDTIHTLKTSNPRFRKLFDAYHEINARIHRAETNIDPMEHLAEEGLRKQRLRLKDEISTLIRAA